MAEQFTSCEVKAVYVYTEYVATLQKKVSRGCTYWQIVESRRINGKPRPVVLMHLGTAAKLLQRLSDSPSKPRTAKVLEFGAIAALWNLADECGLVAILDRHAPKRHQGLSCGEYLLLMAINRCVKPCSKASLYDWYSKTVLTRLLPAAKRALASQRFWDHMGYFDQKRIAAMEEELTSRIIQHFQIDLRTLIFDATNFDTFIASSTPAELPKRGHAKSKRKDLRIIGLALLVSTDFHIPLLSHLYPGNQNDAVTFRSVTEDLAKRYRQYSKECQHITLVFDGGNTASDTIEELDKNGYHFITSLTLTHHQDLLTVPLQKFASFQDPRLEGTTAYRTKKEVWGKQRTVVVTRSETLLRGQLAGIAAALTKKRSALLALRTKLHRSQLPKARGKGYTEASLNKHLSECASGQYISEILKVEIFKKNNRLDFRFHTDALAFDRLVRTRLGKRILCTDNHDWSTQEIILGARSQSHVERAFREMKDPHWISFSPSFHWTDQKLRVHAFSCVLALILSSLLQRKVAQAGLSRSASSLFEVLSEIKELVTLFPSGEKNGPGKPRAEYILSQRSPDQHRLCEALGVYRLAKSYAP